MPRPIEIQTERKGLVLREMATEADDVAFYTAVQESKEHLSQLDDGTGRNFSSIEKVRDARLHPETPGQTYFGAWLDSTFVGSGLITPHNGEAEIAYWTHVDYLRQGIGTQIAKALAAYAAQKYPKVVSQVTKGNIASIRTLERAGFRNTGAVNKDARMVFAYESGEESKCRRRSAGSS